MSVCRLPGQCCKSVLHVLAVCPCCMSELHANVHPPWHVRATCPCYMSLKLKPGCAWCLSKLQYSRCLSMLLVHATGSCCRSILHVHGVCPCRTSMLACPCCISLLLVHAACPCCMSHDVLHVHAACPCYKSLLHAYAACYSSSLLFFSNALME